MQRGIEAALGSPRTYYRFKDAAYTGQLASAPPEIPYTSPEFPEIFSEFPTRRTKGKVRTAPI